MIDDYRSGIAHLHVALQDIGSGMVRLTEVMNQGVREDNQAALGVVALQFRAAAWRVEKGSIKGFAEEEIARLQPRATS